MRRGGTHLTQCCFERSFESKLGGVVNYQSVSDGTDTLYKTPLPNMCVCGDLYLLLESPPVFIKASKGIDSIRKELQSENI